MKTISTACRAGCRFSPRWRRPSPTCTWKTCTAPAASWPFWASWTRGGLINRDLPTVHARTLGDALDRWDIARTNSESVREFFRAAPGGVPTQVAFSQSSRWDELDLDRQTGVIRDVEHAFSKDGGLAVLYGNLAEDGCIVKTAGVDDSILKFTGKAEGLRKPGFGRARNIEPRRGSQGATSSSSAMKARAAAPACRRCSIPRATSSPRAWAKPAR